MTSFAKSSFLCLLSTPLVAIAAAPAMPSAPPWVAGVTAAPAVNYVATVALAGNGFITKPGTTSTAVISGSGLSNWNNAQTVASVYFRVEQAGAVSVGLDASLPDAGSSSLRVSINGTPFTVKLSGAGSKTYDVGTVNVTGPGYIKVDLQGVSKTGSYFANVASVKVGGAATAKGVTFANDAANYYWSRRGPSVNIAYYTPSNTEYFYNEVTVPTGADKIGSYFMANGFGQGYFGMQVKSATERWLLFSVWDADSGKKTTLVRKGPSVVDNVFGGEGSGGQAHLTFNWKAGNTYKFITRAVPDGAGSTLYSAWFFAPEANAWRFIATWKRPETNTYLTGLHSFLENFIDTNGYLTRRMQLTNQWARSASGTWTEATQASYHGDATAGNKQRMDFAGGLEGAGFYLRNGGFFKNYVPLNQGFSRKPTGTPPAVDVSKLP